MESSTVLAFRIFVMLSCLIIVPMAAIFGSAFPDVVKTVLVDRIVSWGTGKPVETTAADAPLAQAPSVAMPLQGNSAPTGNAPAGTANHWEAPRWNGQDNGSTWSPPPHQPSGVVTAGGSTPRSASEQPAGFTMPVGMGRSQPGALPQPGNGAPGGNLLPGPEAERAPSALQEPQRFTAMERRLREYGATYYLLETHGADGQHYRFYCRMASGNNPNYTRDFEATDRDGLQAMAQVLRRVEAWRAGRAQ